MLVAFTSGQAQIYGVMVWGALKWKCAANACSVLRPQYLDELAFSFKLWRVRGTAYVYDAEISVSKLTKFVSICVIYKNNCGCLFML